MVIAIIAILAAMLLPALSAAKIRAQGASDMNNTKQLAIAAIMYAGDNNDHNVPNMDGTLPGPVAGKDPTTSLLGGGTAHTWHGR